MKLTELQMYDNFKFYNKTEKKYYLDYFRKSDESEDRQVASIPDQIKWAEIEKQKRNLTTLSIKHFSESRSAKMPGRPEFNHMISEIYKRHDVKGIICWRLNRLSRNPVDEGTIRWLLQSGEIEEIITSDKVYTQVDSDFVMALECAQSQRFITDLRKDTARGMKSKLDKGIAPILAPPGYRNAIEKRQGERDIVPHPTQFPLMRKLFEYFLTGNYSVQQLWFKAEELGVKSNRGKIISRTQLYECLKNPFYTGTRFIYAGKLYTNGIHKQMITDEEFDQIQEILSKRTRPRAQLHTDLLNGLIKCGECGRGITSEIHDKKLKNGTVNRHIYYRCTKKWRAIKCKQPYIPAQELERQINQYLDGLRLSTRFVEWGIKWLNTMHQNQKEIRESRLISTRQQYDGINRKIDKVIDLMISNILTSEEGAFKKQMLEIEKQRLYATLTKIDTHVSEWSDLAIETFDFIKTVKDKFNNGTIDQKKTILRVIGSNLVLKDKKLTIELRTPFKYVQKVAGELNDKKTSLAFEKIDSG